MTEKAPWALSYLHIHILLDVNARLGLSEAWQNILHGENPSLEAESPATRPGKLCLSHFPFDESARIDVLCECSFEDAGSGSEERLSDINLLET